MSDEASAGLVARIRDHYGRLPPNERKLADLLLDLHDRVSSYSATELAQQAGVSKAAATRLFQRLGYEDFAALRREVRGGSGAAPLDQAGAGTIDTQLSRLLERETVNLTRTVEALRPDEVQAIVRALAGAGQVYVAGFRNSYYLAAYFRQLLVQLRPGALLLPAAGQTLGETLSGVQAGDALVVIGLRRRIPRVRRLLELGRRLELRTLLICDRPAVDLRKLATWTIPVEVHSTGIFDSLGPAITVLGHLATLVAREIGAPARQRLTRMEEILADLHELDGEREG
ncbi:MurR/RpiR family transcriptional regulator [Azospirillum halopraeferens]|uniref:MurR/RpiR family transcriptional regulator n=1 Tax=Azospirillum halopraeferens TaxID=34010 RepID=UPI0003FD0E6E|nr:MurR/RpiR family transcriptional regulator [Azospirillum halopraeferens]